MPLPEAARTAEAQAAPAAHVNSAHDFNPLDAIRILRSAGGALLTQATLHTQLAGVELAEEKNRVLKMHWLTLLGQACLLCLMLMLGVLVLAVSWETSYRIVSVIGLIAVYASCTALVWKEFKAQLALGKNAFAATREELAADIALLKSRL